MFIEMFKELFIEKVSNDCQTGSGVIPNVGPWKGYKAVRTNHLDEPRYPNGAERDEGFDCNTFDALVKGLIKKRPLGLPEGDFAIFWKNKDGVQNAMININKERKTITFITIIQQNKKKPADYRVKSMTAKIDLGSIPEPK
jgi:hypothetical protein